MDHFWSPAKSCPTLLQGGCSDFMPCATSPQRPSFSTQTSKTVIETRVKECCSLCVWLCHFVYSNWIAVVWSSVSLFVLSYIFFILLFHVHWPYRSNVNLQMKTQLFLCCCFMIKYFEYQNNAGFVFYNCSFDHQSLRRMPQYALQSVQTCWALCTMAAGE